MGDWAWTRLSAADKRAILAGLSGGPPGGPYHVELQPSDRCGLGCFFCSTRHRRRDDEMPIERMPRLLGELKSMGTRAITLCGGGEPLGYRHIDRLIEILARLHLPIEHVTTNGLHLTPERSRRLRDGGLDHVIVSLNAPDAASYARVMRTPEATFHLVLDHIRSLVAARGISRRPEIVVQFALYRGSHLDIPRMYELALGLGVDKILFTELAFLDAELRLGAADTQAMVDHFADIVARDGFRFIGAINSFDRSIARELAPLRVHGASILARARRLVHGAGTPLQKAAHYVAWRRRQRASRVRESHDGACLVPWYSLVVLADGGVPVCPVLQDRRVANVFEAPVRDVWHGDAMGRVRRQVRNMLARGACWQRDPAADDGIETMCSSWSPRPCNFREFYYGLDVAFLRQLHRQIDTLRAEAAMP